MSDNQIKCLPDEMIAIILSYNDITMDDIISFGMMCKKCPNCDKYDPKLLEEQLSQRWPYAKEKYESLKEKENRENINFVALGIYSMLQLRNYLSHILFYDYYYTNRWTQNYFHRSIDRVFEFKNVMDFSGNIDAYINPSNDKKHEPINKLQYMFYIEEIKWLTKFRQGIDRELIQSYCSIERFHYAKLFSIGNELDTYIKNESKQLLEEACTFVAKYIQVRKDVCYANVSATLDTIAQEVLNRLRVKHPNHSIFSTSDVTFSYWKTNNIEDNHWDETESTQIMDTLQEYIFGTLKFRTCISLPEDIKYLCIDYVLQNQYGQDIIVYTIFHSVARRLGLRCDVINASYFHDDTGIVNRFCIFWKPKFGVMDDLKNSRCLCLRCDNCLTDYYVPKYCKFFYNRRTIRKMLEDIKTINSEFIMKHKIQALQLIEVACYTGIV